MRRQDILKKNQRNRSRQRKDKLIQRLECQGEYRMSKRSTKKNNIMHLHYESVLDEMYIREMEELSQDPNVSFVIAEQYPRSCSW